MSHSQSKSGRGQAKVERLPIKIDPTITPLRKPVWIRARAPSGEGVGKVRSVLRQSGLHTVCEEAACPNLGECFSHGTATFMILGDVCTRRCPFCDVAHGQPAPIDSEEPARLAAAIRAMELHYVVITSVDRDDLRDGGAGHFADCIAAIRQADPRIRLEILVPDFRGRLDLALAKLMTNPPDVFNHNLETVPRLYRSVRPGADYAHSLALLAAFKKHQPDIPTKSGIMLGLGETLEEVQQVMKELREHGCNMLTLGQYLQPSRHHLAVTRFIHPDEFIALRDYGVTLGFTNVASGPMVRSSYQADRQATCST